MPLNDLPPWLTGEQDRGFLQGAQLGISAARTGTDIAATRQQMSQSGELQPFRVAAADIANRLQRQQQEQQAAMFPLRVMALETEQKAKGIEIAKGAFELSEAQKELTRQAEELPIWARATSDLLNVGPDLTKPLPPIPKELTGKRLADYIAAQSRVQQERSSLFRQTAEAKIQQQDDMEIATMVSEGMLDKQHTPEQLRIARGIVANRQAEQMTAEAIAEAGDVAGPIPVMNIPLLPTGKLDVWRFKQTLQQSIPKAQPKWMAGMVPDETTVTLPSGQKVTFKQPKPESNKQDWILKTTADLMAKGIGAADAADAANMAWRESTSPTDPGATEAKPVELGRLDTSAMEKRGFAFVLFRKGEKLPNGAKAETDTVLRLQPKQTKQPDGSKPDEKVKEPTPSIFDALKGVPGGGTLAREAEALEAQRTSRLKAADDAKAEGSRISSEYFRNREAVEKSLLPRDKKREALNSLRLKWIDDYRKVTGMTPGEDMTGITIGTGN